jgi:HEXXH motif-containing protein
LSEEAASPRHLIDPARLHALATGGGGQHVVAPFWSTERSWRLVALRYLADKCAARSDAAGPLDEVDSAWRLLTDAFEADPDVCEDVLAQPQVGIWAAYTLRRLHGWPHTDPLWMDVGYLHAMAAACAVRARLKFELTVPVRHGNAGLPTVGTATFPDDLTHVTARSDGGALALGEGALTVRAGPGDPRWHEPVRIGATVGGSRLDLTLLDRDVYRNLLEPEPPRPLTEPEIVRWREMVTGAWRTLVDEHPERASAIAVSLRTVTPRIRRAPYRPESASSAEAFGGILVSEPDSPTEFAATLVHEVQHLKLGALLHLLTLVEPDPERRYYAAWRDDPRPLDGLLQGLYAFVGVTDFWRVHREKAGGGERSLAQFEFALWRRQALGAAEVLADSGHLTERGQSFVEILRDRLQSWRDDPVPAAIERRVEAMAHDHHALWRAGCMPVSAEIGAALLATFRAGDPLPGTLVSDLDQTVVALPRVGRLDGRAVLTRHCLATGGAVRTPVSGTTAADVDLVSGEAERARKAYVAALGRDPADAHALVGLGLTLERPDDPARRALLGRPELLLAMTRHGAEPLAAADWLGRRLPSDPWAKPRPRGWPVA